MVARNQSLTFHESRNQTTLRLSFFRNRPQLVQWLALLSRLALFLIFTVDFYECMVAVITYTAQLWTKNSPTWFQGKKFTFVWRDEPDALGVTSCGEQNVATCLTKRSSCCHQPRNIHASGTSPAVVKEMHFIARLDHYCICVSRGTSLNSNNIRQKLDPL